MCQIKYRWPIAYIIFETYKVTFTNEKGQGQVNPARHHVHMCNHSTHLTSSVSYVSDQIFDLLLTGHRYGNTLVPMTEDDKANMKYKAEKCFKVLGITKAENVRLKLLYTMA